MQFKEFLRYRRLELDLTQAELAERLTIYGHATKPARVGHWETGRNRPPLTEASFRSALALALQMDVNRLLSEIGYVVRDEDRSKEAMIAAEIVEGLPPDAKQLAIDYLHVLEKRFHN